MEDGSINGKYLVERSDGHHHPNARYFVLNYASDPYARAAMLAYAEACADTHPRLSQDIRSVVDYHESRDAERRRDPSKPVRGTQASGGEVASDEDLVDVLRQRVSDDPDLAKALRAMLTDVKRNSA
jgi:hypothetical protein